MRKRLCVLVVLVLVLSLLPSAALARPAKASVPPRAVRPQVAYGPDIYEPDDTSATAKAVPLDSVHTNQYEGPNASDTDWFTFSAETTGEPFGLELQYLDGYWDSWMQVFKAEPDGTMAPLTTRNDDDSLFWSYGSSLYFTAPAPGVYYGCIQQRDGYYGKYELHISPGIARRLGGADRYQTAAVVAKRMYDNTMNPAWGGEAGPVAIMLVNGQDAPDAMTAGALGGMYEYNGDDWKAPVLLTTRDVLPAATRDRIENLAYGQSTTVYVVGGPSVISDEQIAYIKTLPNVANVVRVAGKNRFATAAAVASEAVDSVSTVDTVYIVNGFSWVDGLSAGPVAAGSDSPILLSNRYALASETTSWLADHPDVTNAVIVGSPSVVDTDVATQLEDAGLTVTRVGGGNRYETARLIAQYGVDNGYVSADSLILCTGEKFADGLCATPMAAMAGCPILLTPSTGLSDEVKTFWNDNGPTSDRSYIIGGPLAIPNTVGDAFKNLWDQPV